MVIQAPLILSMTGEELSPHRSIRVRDELIVECGDRLTPAPGEEEVCLDHHILMPGMINSPCHLDYTGLRGAIFQGHTFTNWIKRINALKQSLQPEDYLKAIQEGYELLLRSGCTSVCNLAAFPELLLKLERPPLRVWWFLELIDVRTRISGDDTLMGALHFFESRADWLGGFGLAPHAPYTASIELFRLAKHCSETMGMLFTTHIAESLDEQEMFLYGAGEMFTFLSSLGRDMSDCGHGSPLSHLMEFGLLNKQCLAVHLNYLQEYDYEHLRKQPLQVVHCPLCHDYFRHRRFPLDEIEATGSDILIGTDSLASNHTLDLRAEIRHASAQYPHKTFKWWLEGVTQRPASALGMQGKLGVIEPGALADVVAFAFEPGHPPANPYRHIIESTVPPDFLMIHGETL